MKVPCAAVAGRDSSPDVLAVLRVLGASQCRSRMKMSPLRNLSNCECAQRVLEVPSNHAT